MTTLVGNQAEFSFLIFTCQVAGLTEQPLQGPDPMCWPWLGWSRLDHHGKLLLPELEHSIAVALILQNCGSDESLLTAKRMILQQSPNLTCWVKKLPLHLEDSSSTEGNGLRHCCVLEFKLLEINSSTYLPNLPLWALYFFASIPVVTATAPRANSVLVLIPVIVLVTTGQIMGSTSRLFCSEVAVQIALQHFTFIVC